MNHTESVSDSDSSTSSSWIFVDDCEVESESDKNKYYLNCSSEPVQELTSQCLHSTSLEQETDSDGISIISESDDSKENTLIDDQLVTDNSNDFPIENITHHEGSEVGDEFYFNKYIVLLWIVIAVATPFLLNYFSSNGETTIVIRDEIVDDGTVQPLKSLTKKEFITPLGKERKFPGNGIEILEYYDHQPSGNNEIHEAKRKYDSKGEVDVHRLDCKDREHLCDKSNEHKNREKKGKNKKGEFTKDIKYDFKDSLAAPKDNFKPNLIGERKVATKTDGHNLQTKIIKKKPKVENEKSISESNEIPQKSLKKKNSRKEAELKIDNSFKKKNKSSNEEHPKHQKEKKSKEENKKRSNSGEEYPHKEVKKLKKLLENKDRDIKKLKKLVKTKDKQLKTLEYKILKELNMLRRSEINGNQFQMNIENQKSYKDKVNRTSGDWYHNLYKGRSKYRNQQHASNWVFDRANFRSRKRNMKNNWYWNWMADRELLRLKKGFWHFTY